MVVLQSYIKRNYDKFSRIALNLTKGDKRDAQDLVQEFYLSTLEYKDQDKLKQICANGHFVFWGTRVMVQMYYRERDFFKRKYHREQTYSEKNVTELDWQTYSDTDYDSFKEKEKQYDKIEKSLSELHWYDRKIIEIYYGINVPKRKGYSVRALAKATGISASSLFHTIKKTKKYLKGE